MLLCKLYCYQNDVITLKNKVGGAHKMKIVNKTSFVFNKENKPVKTDRNFKTKLCPLQNEKETKCKRTCCVGLYLNISLVSRYHLTEWSFCSSILKWQLSSAARRGSAYSGTFSCDMSCADVIAVKEREGNLIHV